MEAPSVLFLDPKYIETLDRIEGAPEFFSDLNLDKLVEAAVGNSRREYLKKYFYLPLRSKEEVLFRQEIMRNLEDRPLRERIVKFSKKMEVVRSDLDMMKKISFKYHKEGYFLEAALLYIRACLSLQKDFHSREVFASGLRSFRDYLDDYLGSAFFLSLKRKAFQVKEMLSKISYCITISSNGFKVDTYKEEEKYTPKIERLFEKFRRDAERRHFFKSSSPSRKGYMNHIEEKILEFVARLFPEQFKELDKFCSEFKEFLDRGVDQFDREVQFYLTYHHLISDLITKRDLGFCYPEVSSFNKEICIYGGFDVALACTRKGKDVVLNDLTLREKQRIVVITGPNQGGKTTFARMIGQIHHLARLGLPVPAKRARVFLCDMILTHFERQESVINFQGKLEEELTRMHDLLSLGSCQSLFVLNEMFASTTLEDALFLNREVLNRISEMDALAVCVTFIDELSHLNENTVSMVAEVLPEDPSIRTFKIIERPSDGRAYALSLAYKHGLTYRQIKERMENESIFNAS